MDVMMNCGIRIEFVLAALLLFLPTGNASITVLSSGNQYESRADERLGKTFWKGYEYSARLQYVIGNYDACDTSREMWNITVPQDGLPVAILVRHDGCSIEQKARFVSQYLYPPNIVKYMIIDGDGSLSATEDLDDEFLALHEEDGFFDDHDTSAERLQMPDWSFKGDDITVGIMHVSTKSGQKLLASIFADKAHKSGPRIMIDGGVSDVGNREVFLWMALSALLSACACIFMLAAHNGTINFLQREQENQQHPQRPQRRRLTREQVRKLFPRFEFDGSGLRPGVQTSGVLNAEGFPYVTTTPPPTPLEMSCCSICLDDYEPGDRLRVLPCNHAFHARCIGKWLAERSATCPLCKMEIWDDEDEQSDSDDEEAATAEESSPSAGARDPMTSQLWNMIRFHGETSQEQTEGSTTWQEQQRQQRRQPPLIPSASAMATWVTQFVRRNRRRPFGATTTQEMVETTSLNTLTEPLLQSETTTDPSSEPLVQLENGGEPVIAEVTETVAESELTEPAEESALGSTSPPQDEQE